MIQKNKKSNTTTQHTLNKTPSFFSQQYKITMLGGGAVGKSSLTVQLVCNHFIQNYDPTIEDSYRMTLLVDGRTALLDILDTAGQEEYSAMRSQYMRSGQGYILVYDITSRQSFEEITEFRKHLYQARDLDYSQDLPVTLVGNKCDLDHLRQVSSHEGKELAKSFRWNFLETSALSRINVEESFQDIVKLIRKHKQSQDNLHGNKKKKGFRRMKQCKVV